jgi:general secretion pathway protein C
MHTATVVQSTPGSHAKGEITDAGDRKIIDKSVIDYYRKNFKEIGRNIGIAESRKGGALDGFKVTFVRRGSDFEKLGLQRNDVIKAVNGEPVNSYKAAMDIYRKVGTMDNMTLTINRGNEEMELEYEVN